MPFEFPHLTTYVSEHSPLQKFIDLGPPNFELTEPRQELKNNQSALEFVVTKGRLDLLKYIVENFHPDLSVEHNRHTLLYWGLKSKNLSICEYIMSQLPSSAWKANELIDLYITTKDIQILSKLEFAIKNNNGVNQFLPTLEDEDTAAVTPLSIVKTSNFPHQHLKALLFKLLLEHGADIYLGTRPIIKHVHDHSDLFAFVVCEMVIRGDLYGLGQLEKKTETPVGDYMLHLRDVLGDRQLSPDALLAINEILNDMVSSKKLDQNTKDLIYPLLQMPSGEKKPIAPQMIDSTYSVTDIQPPSQIKELKDEVKALSTELKKTNEKLDKVMTKLELRQTTENDIKPMRRTYSGSKLW